MNRLKKGQVTMFIILGMIILFFFLLVHYQTSIQNQKLLDQIENQVSTLVRSSSTQNFITLCLEKTIKEGVYLIGQQGGYIYDYQGGYIHPRYDHWSKQNIYRTIVAYDLLDKDNGSEYIKYNLSYSLYYNQSKNLTYLTPLPPLYPAHPDTGKVRNENDSLVWPGYTIREEIMPRYGYDWREAKYYLGETSGFFPKLCLKGGKNYLAGQDQNWSQSGCGDGAYAEIGDDTIQEQLEYYIDNNLKKCTNFEELKKQLPATAGAEIIEKNISSIVFFGDNDLTVESYYPIEIRINNRNSKVVINEFQVRMPIRLKAIWKHINDLLYKDSIRFSYNKNSNVIQGNQFWDQSFKYTMTSLGFDDLYTISDSRSLIDQKPYQFKALIENRRPALEYIHKELTPRKDLDCFDLISWPGQTVLIEPIGYDPDEDELTYDYGGWKETYDTNYIEQCYRDLGPIDCTKDMQDYLDCETRYEGAGLWTDDLDFYLNDNRTGMYEVLPRDIGVHKLNVSVFDGEMKDWQELLVLIFDTPRLVITSDNFYDDIDNRYASIEDYILIGSSSASSLLTLDNFMIKAEPNSGTGWEAELEDNQRMLVPTLEITDSEKVSPERMYEERVVNDEVIYKFFNPPKQYNMVIRADNGIEVGQSNITLDVKECLPHRGDYGDPYPYFQGDDPYQANHVCCIGVPDNPSQANWGTVRGDDEICFNRVYYGSYLSFDYTTLVDYYELPANLPEYGPNLNNLVVPSDVVKPSGPGQHLSVSSDLENDIFVRTFTRNCDGDQGNICGGEIEDTIDVISCDDNSGGTLRCQGPDSDLLSDLRQTNGYATCDEYNGYTFEYVQHFAETRVQDDSLLVCNNVRECTSNDLYGTYGDGGDYSCQATCIGGGCNKPANCVNCGITSCEFEGGVYNQFLPGYCQTSSGGCIRGNLDHVCEQGYACDGTEGYEDGNLCTTQGNCNHPNQCASGYTCNAGDCVPES